MKKREQIKQIIQKLLEQKRLQFTQKEIEDAIVQVRELADPRSIEKWFLLMWRLGYFIQPEYELFQINLQKTMELEVKLPIQVDPKQSRLGGYQNT